VGKKGEKKKLQVGSEPANVTGTRRREKKEKKTKPVMTKKEAEKSGKREIAKTGNLSLKARDDTTAQEKKRQVGKKEGKGKG